MEDIAVQVLRALVNSNTIEKFFEKLSANLWNLEPIRGFELYVPSSPGTLELAYAYTHTSVASPKTIELGENSCCSKAFNRRELCRDPEDGPAISFPVEDNGLIAGVYSLHLTTVEAIDRLCENDLRSISIALSAFLQFGGSPTRTIGRRAIGFNKTTGHLTGRQVRILRMMSSERTYHQIASELHVSESLVKLESSRIFKYLRVQSKAEAIAASEKYFAEQVAPPPPVMV